METGKGNLGDWKQQTTADEIFRVRDSSAESQAGRLLDYTEDGPNKRTTPMETPQLKAMCDVAAYLGPCWDWIKAGVRRHEIYGMSEGKRQTARDDFGTVLSRDLQEKREREKGGFLSGLLGRFGGGGGEE
jgi:hypothetical protein